VLHCAATILTTEAVSVLTSLRNKGEDFWTAKVAERLAPKGEVNAEVVAATSSRMEIVREANMVIECADSTKNSVFKEEIYRVDG
jgi:ornithine cyclodeaminase/alanine dehydrogenase-like protein (mu-crystallin family)